jgi:hypothetical protein
MIAVGQGFDLTSVEGSGVEVNRSFIAAGPGSLGTKVPSVFGCCL